MPQYTLRQAVAFDGVGLHTGERCRVRVLPAAPGAGIALVSDGQEIPARAEFVTATRRAVTLGEAGVEVSTVEHLLASLSALRLDNARIDVSGPEIPALDGSAARFVEALAGAGRRRQPGDAPVVRLADPVWVTGEDALLLALPYPALRVTYNGAFPGVARRSLDRRVTPAVFARDIAPARTTAFRAEIEALLAQGLGLGGSLDTVVVIEPDGPSGTTRFPDEPLRHKLLDLVGDLSLLGARLQAHVIAVRSGHRLNLELVKEIGRRR